MASRRPLPLTGAVAFSLTQIPIGALALALSVHLPRYFAAHMGLSLAMVGASFALVRALDIPIDPLLGLSMDRTRTRLGRYRVWTIIGAPLLMAALYALMHPPAQVGQAYLVAALLVMFIGYSSVFLSQLAWASVLADSYEQRSRLFAMVTGAGVVGAVAVLITPVIMQRMGYSDAEGVQAMVWFIIIAAPVTAAITAAVTPEPLPADHASGFQLRDYLAVLRRPNVVRVVISNFFVELGPDWMAGLYLFYFINRRGFDVSQANLLLLVYMLAGFAGAPFIAWVAKRTSKHRALQISCFAYSACLVTVPFLPRGNFVAALGPLFVAGAAFWSFLVMLRALAADISDETRLEVGRHAAGLIFSLTNASTKLASAMGIFLTFRVLTAVGFDPREGAVNTAAALRGLEFAFLGGPVFFVITGGLLFLGYKLDSARHAQIRDELERRDRGQESTEDLAAETAQAASLRAISTNT